MYRWRISVVLLLSGLSAGGCGSGLSAQQEAEMRAKFPEWYETPAEREAHKKQLDERIRADSARWSAARHKFLNGDWPKPPAPSVNEPTIDGRTQETYKASLDQMMAALPEEQRDILFRCIGEIHRYRAEKLYQSWLQTAVANGREFSMTMEDAYFREDQTRGEALNGKSAAQIIWMGMNVAVDY